MILFSIGTSFCFGVVVVLTVVISSFVKIRSYELVDDDVVAAILCVSDCDGMDSIDDIFVTDKVPVFSNAILLHYCKYVYTIIRLKRKRTSQQEIRFDNLTIFQCFDTITNGVFAKILGRRNVLLCKI